LKPLLIQFDYLPDVVYGVGRYGDINTVDIPLDSGIVEKLRER